MSSSNDLDLDGKKVIVNLDRDSIYKEKLLKVLEEGLRRISFELRSVSHGMYMISDKISFFRKIYQ